MKFTSLQPGTTLRDGTYVIEKVLGQGGFGITYLALDRNLEKKVAIKEFFPKELCGRDSTTSHITVGQGESRQLVEDLKKKFLKEARNIAKLNYPNIIKIYAAFEEHDTAYYVMEYIEGGTLSDLVKSRGPLPLEQATKYTVTIGETLEYLHQHHMTHHDVKPANVIINKETGDLVLIDFGLSKNYDGAGNETTTMGLLGISAGFSPLEQYTPGGIKTFSPKSDLYALAATYYYLLTGVVPPDAPSNVGNTLNFPAGIPAHIRQAISMAMSPGMGQRHESVKEFLLHLQGNAPRQATSNEATQMVGGGVAGEATRIVAGHGRSGNASPHIIDTPLPESQEPQKKGISLTYIASFIGLLAIVAVLVVILVIRGGSDKKEVVVDNLAADTTEVVAASEPAQTATPAEAPQNPYGPFSGKSEIEQYIESFYDIIGGGIYDPSFFAPDFASDFNRYRPVSGQQFVNEIVTSREKAGVSNAYWTFDWSTLHTSPLPNGGVKASFTCYYHMTLYSGKTLNYRCTNAFDINSARQLSLYYERIKAM